MKAVQIMKQVRNRAVIVLLGLCAAPAIVHAQGYCWGDCPSNAIRVCTGIVLDGYCVDNPTQEQLNRYKTQQQQEQERKRRQEKERRERETEFRRLVDIEVKRLGGETRRPEAERFVRMRQEAEAARKRSGSLLATETPKSKAKQCTSRTFNQTMANSHSDQATAKRLLSKAIAMKTGANITGSESVISMSGGAPSCSQRAISDTLKRPPIGKCLACMTEQQAALLGYIPGKGWPAPKTEWSCKAVVKVVAEKCSSGPSAVSRQ